VSQIILLTCLSHIHSYTVYVEHYVNIMCNNYVRCSYVNYVKCSVVCLNVLEVATKNLVNL